MRAIFMALFAITAMGSAVKVYAGTPTYIGPYTYHASDSAKYDNEGSAIQEVYTNLKSTGRDCNYILNPPTAPWGHEPTSEVEGFPTHEGRPFNVSNSRFDGGGICRPEYGTFYSQYGSYRDRVVCSSTQMYVADGDKCVTLTPVNIPDYKASNGGHACPCVGEPINPGTGHMCHDEIDLALSGRSGQLALQRMYNSDRYANASLDKSRRSFGARWSQRYDASLKQVDPMPDFKSQKCWRRADTGELICPQPNQPIPTDVPAAVMVDRGDGKSFVFNLSGNVWSGDADTNDRLTVMPLT